MQHLRRLALQVTLVATPCSSLPVFFVGIYLAVGLVWDGTSSVRRLEVCRDGLHLRTHGILSGLDVHRELQPLAPMERVPRTWPRPHVAEAAQDHGHPVGREALLE